MTKVRLEPKSWIKAAFRALTNGGPQAIRIEAIARDLKVSKGSFYWHFKDVGALKTAMLAHWKEFATGTIIDQLGEMSETAESKLRMLVTIVTGPQSDAYGGKLVEPAIRDWARYDAGVAETVREVDRQRIRFVQKLFAETGDKPEIAGQKAAILYGGLIGLDILDHHDLASVGPDLNGLLERLLND